MPYIKKDERKCYKAEIKSIVKKLVDREDENEVYGHLNFIIFTIMKKYVAKKGERYFRYNNLVGMLECCKQELYRRLVANYENQAITKNGDIDDDD